MPTIQNDFGDRAFIYKAPGCGDLPVLRCTDEKSQPVCVSCWQLSWDEQKQLIDNDGKIYFFVWGGGQPPISVGVDNPLAGMGTPAQILAEMEDKISALNLAFEEFKHQIEADPSEETVQQIDTEVSARVAQISTLRWVLGLEPGRLFKK